MIVKLLGFFDLISAVFFWIFVNFGLIPAELIILLAVYLLIKGIVFLTSGGLANIFDILCAMIMFISTSVQLPLAWFFSFIIAAYLTQKAILSFVA